MTHTLITDEKKIISIIADTWEGDDEFFDKYAVNETPELSVADTTEKVLAFTKAYNAKFYSLTENGRLLGYINVATELGLLYSFGLKKTYRTKKYKEEFLSIIYGLFPNGQVAVSLYKKNTRAINFFIKNGFEENKEECVTLIKNI